MVHVIFVLWIASAFVVFAQGLWLTLLSESCPTQNAGPVLPNVTVAGSSNFGRRSVERDLESQVCLAFVDMSRD